MKKIPLVSIIIPTKNSDLFLEDCLRSIKNQVYKNIDVLVIDGSSSDNTLSISKKYSAKIYSFHSKIPVGKFDAPYKRNYGVTKSRGEIIYYLDADMVLPECLIQEIVTKIQGQDFDALVVPEDSFGIGIWAKAKQLERRCYWGDTTIEAARVFKSKVYHALGGLDTSLGGGGDDWDLHNRLLSNNYNVGRTTNIVGHNEGKLSLIHLIKKRFMYGQDSIKYFIKSPKSSFKSYFPIRAAYVRNWRLFVNSPTTSLCFVAMRTCEYLAGFMGIIYSWIKK